MNIGGPDWVSFGLLVSLSYAIGILFVGMIFGLAVSKNFYQKYKSILLLALIPTLILVIYE